MFLLGSNTGGFRYIWSKEKNISLQNLEMILNGYWRFF